MKPIRLFLLFIIALLIFGLWEARPAAACSGGSPAMEDFLTEEYVIVKARPVDVDDLNQNGILRVESYIWGTGPEYLLFVQNEPLVTTGLLEGFLGTGDCNSLYSFTQPNQSEYYVLSRAEGGYYTSSFIYPQLVFPTEDTTQMVLILTPTWK